MNEFETWLKNEIAYARTLDQGINMAGAYVNGRLQALIEAKYHYEKESAA